MFAWFSNMIRHIIKSIITALIHRVLPSGINDEVKELILVKVYADPMIQKKLNILLTKIMSQIQVSSVMTINGLIGLIPVPTIPGIVRDLNNGIFC